MRSVTICSSATFYRHVIALKDELETHGITAYVPENALIMQSRNDFDVSHYKTWYENDADYVEKSRLMRTHFEAIERGDVLLIVNDTKHDTEHYIGGNVLIEMSLGFYLNKPIYLLNDLPEASSFIEEIKGMQPHILKGSINQLVKDIHG